MILDTLNENMTTIALVIVALAVLIGWLRRGDEPEAADQETVIGEEISSPEPRRRRWGREDEDEDIYRMEKDNFREDERYDFVEDDEVN
ncbi:MAG: hypothetical protein KJ064_15505 [Anaerolineae bacterium]|nr:hypothetical protein [Anaerolineae bacterium]